MIINRAYRYELKPNVRERILMAKHAGCARFAYNWGLARRIALYQTEKVYQCHGATPGIE
ncbi:Helix-turn-helix domain protein [Pelotomaculum schinkii]|uniref:Helix-turn-helix domain protein n=1 Tax=Pelotomaculum schinkii TaxID=78350 RepID=A0A4Y7RAI2_9FIRM|nr:helix-turn-helix domain-containing protein [Pelotomaculum schinkii]TEB05671.1 Helix-turn-helix domain protein [Pelotomaculum schinkii]